MPALLRYIVEKGSVALAGVSLTVNAVDAETFSIAIIPHTRDATTLGASLSMYRPGARNSSDIG